VATLRRLRRLRLLAHRFTAASHPSTRRSKYLLVFCSLVCFSSLVPLYSFFFLFFFEMHSSVVVVVVVRCALLDAHVRAKSSHEITASVLEKAVSAGLSELQSYVPLFDAAIDYHVRRLRAAAHRYQTDHANAADHADVDVDERAHHALAVPLGDTRFWFNRADTFFTDNAAQQAVIARQVINTLHRSNDTFNLSSLTSTGIVQYRFISCSIRTGDRRVITRFSDEIG
jgi:hypothetical protein